MYVSLVSQFSITEDKEFVLKIDSVYFLQAIRDYFSFC